MNTTTTKAQPILRVACFDRDREKGVLSRQRQWPGCVSASALGSTWLLVVAVIVVANNKAPPSDSDEDG